MKSPIVATEFVGTSVSTTGDRSDITDAQKAMVAENPGQILQQPARLRDVQVTKDRMKADYRVVDFVTRPGASIKTRASFVVEAGRPEPGPPTGLRGRMCVPRCPPEAAAPSVPIRPSESIPAPDVSPMVKFV